MKRPIAYITMVFLGILITLKLALPDLFELEMPLCMEKYENGEEIVVVGKISDISHQVQFETETTKVILEDVILLLNNSLEGRKQTVTTSNQSIICYFSNKQKFNIGSQVVITGKLNYFEPATNPGEFDAKKYYGNHQVLFAMKQCKLLREGTMYSKWRQLLFDIRCSSELILDDYLDAGEASIMKAMLLGEKEKLSNETKVLYQKNGIAHILAISGLHISLIGMGIYEILHKFNLPKEVCVVITLGFLILFGVMVGLSASTKRAIIMFSLVMLSKMVKRSYDIVTSLSVAFILLIFSNYRLIGDCGFQLSFMAIYGIGVFFPVCKKASGEIENFLWKISKNHMLYKILCNFKNALLSSFSVTAVTIPILAYHFYEISFLSILLNLLIIPLMTVLVGCGGMLLIIGSRLHWIGLFCSYVISHILYVYEKSCILMQAISVGRVNVSKPSIVIICVYYSMIFASTILVKKKRYRYHFFICILNIIFLLNIPKQQFSVWTLDVGQGDCSVIFSESGHVYIVDCGSTTKYRVGEKILIPFLKSKGVNEISGVFLTHSDIDHMSGIEELIQLAKQENLDVKNLYLNEMESGKGFEDMIAKAKEHGIGVRGISAGSVLRDGGMMLSCIYPYSWQKNLEGNDASLVLYLENEHFNGVLTGDLELSGEKEIIEREMLSERMRHVTWLKVGHHGSSTSSSEVFLKFVAPQFATISCGKHNVYGHPHKETLKRLDDVSANVLTTSQYGAISIETRRGGGVRIRYYAPEISYD